MKHYNLASFHQEVVQERFQPDIPIEESMAVFTVLHSCKLRLRYPAIANHSEMLVLDPITTRDCADALAAIWQDVPGSRFTSEYFYLYWNTEWCGYSRLEDVSAADSKLALHAKKILESHPVIAEVVPDDWNPFVPNPTLLSR